MKKLIASCLFAFALTGCAALQAVQSFSISQNTLDGLRQSYNTAFLVPAKNYRQLGYCATGEKWTLEIPCADKGVVAKLRVADAAVLSAFNNLQNMISSGNNAGISAAYNSLLAAIDAAKAILPKEGA